MSTEILPLDPERFRLKPVITSKEATRRRPPFTPLWLPWLADRKFDQLFAAKTRLWLLLLIKTREGRKPVVLTNRVVADIGIGKDMKARYLRQLVKAGFISVMQVGHQAPIVTLNVTRPAMTP